MIVTIRAMKTYLTALSSGCFYTRHMIPENMQKLIDDNSLAS